MNIKKLKKELGGAATVRGSRDHVSIEMAGATFNVDRSKWKNEGELAQYLRSCVPGMVVGRK